MAEPCSSRASPVSARPELLDVAAEAASADATRVIRAAGVEFEAGTSFSGLNQVLLPLLDALPQLPAVHRDALNVALGFGEGAPPSRLVVSNAALVLLRQAATARPLLVIIDDLPWLDRASAGVLSFVARRLEGSQVGLLGASRTGEEDFFDHAGLPELEVQPLDDAAARQLLDARFPDLASDRSRPHPGRGAREPARAVGAPGRARPGHARVRRACCRRRSRSVGGCRRYSDRGSPSFRLGRGSSCCSWRSMAPETCASWRPERARDAGFRDLAPAEQARLAYLDEATHRLAFHHPLMRSAVVELVAGARSVEPPTACLPTCGQTSPTAERGISRRRPSSRTKSVAAQLEAAAARILARGDAVGCVKALTRSSELSPGTQSDAGDWPRPPTSAPTWPAT